MGAENMPKIGVTENATLEAFHWRGVYFVLI